MNSVVVHNNSWDVIPSPSQSFQGDGNTTNDRIRVKVLCAGLCRTDISAMSGAYDLPQGRILGHEGSGMITHIPLNLIEKANKKGLLTGDMVAFYPFLPCNECDVCKQNGPIENCFNPSSLGLDEDGVFAPFIDLPLKVLFKGPSNLSLKHLAYAEPVSAAISILDFDILKVASKVGVLGQGRIANLTLKVLNSIRGDMPTHLITPLDVQMYKNGQASIIQNSLEDNSFDVIIETWPSEDMIEVGVRLLKHNGLFICKSRPSQSIKWPHRLITLKKIKIEGSSYGSFQKALDLMSDGSLNVDDMLGCVYPLNKEGVESALKKEFEEGEGAGKLFFEIDPNLGLVG